MPVSWKIKQDCLLSIPLSPRLNTDQQLRLAHNTLSFQFASKYRTHPGVLDKLSYATDILVLQKCLGKSKSNVFSVQWYKKKISEKKICHCTYLHTLVTIFFRCLCFLCWSRFYKVLGVLSRHNHNPLRKQICQLLDFPGLAHKLHQQVKQNCRTTFFSVKLQFSCRDLGCL